MEQSTEIGFRYPVLVTLAENPLLSIELSRLRYNFDQVELWVGHNHFNFKNN
jgi:hypothetical protein